MKREASDGRGADELRSIDRFRLSDLEAVTLLLRGESVIDWYRLNFTRQDEIDELIRAQEIAMEDARDRARVDTVRDTAIDYLRRHFDFPIPKPVAASTLSELIALASSKGHRQLCACTILKVMHIVHHLEARELLYMLPVSDQEVFQLVEEKVYRVIGGMLARGFPIIEFTGGRKNRDSLYTKLLSKSEVLAAQIYDKVRFRIVTRTPDDIFPTLNYLMRHVFPFNYVIPGQSVNTLFQLRSYCGSNDTLGELAPQLQHPLGDDPKGALDNRFTASTYRVVNFVADLPVRVPDALMRTAPAQARSLGRVVFVQTEFQVIDRETEQRNEEGEASHSAYKRRQRQAVVRRLKLGTRDATPPSEPAELPREPTVRRRRTTREP